MSESLIYGHISRACSISTRNLLELSVLSEKCLESGRGERLYSFFPSFSFAIGLVMRVNNDHLDSEVRKLTLLYKYARPMESDAAFADH